MLCCRPPRESRCGVPCSSSDAAKRLRRSKVRNMFMRGPIVAARRRGRFQASGRLQACHMESVVALLQPPRPLMDSSIAAGLVYTLPSSYQQEHPCLQQPLLTLPSRHQCVQLPACNNQPVLTCTPARRRR